MIQKPNQVTVLDGAVTLDIRPSNYRSLVIERGLTRKLQEDSILQSEENDILIVNFASFVARTLKVTIDKSVDNPLVTGWGILWTAIEKHDYMRAYDMFLDLSEFGEVTLSSLWDGAIASTKAELEGDPDLLPPEKLTPDQKKVNVSAKSA
jgi:hypothetical protein